VQKYHLKLSLTQRCEAQVEVGLKAFLYHRMALLDIGKAIMLQVLAVVHFLQKTMAITFS